MFTRTFYTTGSNITMDESEYSENQSEQLKRFIRKLWHKYYFLQFVKVEDAQAAHVENEATRTVAEELPAMNFSSVSTNAQCRENWQKVEAEFQETRERVDYLRKMYLTTDENHRKLCETTSKALQECENLNNLCSMLFLQDAHILSSLSKINDIFVNISFVEKTLKLKSEQKAILNAELQCNSASLARKILQASLESVAVALENSTLSELLLETHRKLHAIIDEKNRQLKALKLLNCEFHDDLMLANYLTGMLSQVEAEVVERERSLSNLTTVYNREIKDPDIEMLQSALEFRIQLANEGISETTELLTTLCNDLEKSGLYFEKEVIKERIAKVELKRCRLENEQSLASLTELESVISDTRERLEEEAVILDVLYKKMRKLEKDKNTNRSYLFILNFFMPTNENEQKLKQKRIVSLNRNYVKMKAKEKSLCQSRVEKECLLQGRLPLRNCLQLPLTVNDLPLVDADCDAVNQLFNERDNELSTLENWCTTINGQNSMDEFWQTARDKIEQLERAILLAFNNGQCDVADTIVQKLKIILLKITTVEDILSELLTYCEIMLRHECGATKYAASFICSFFFFIQCENNYIENEIKVLTEKYDKLKEQYENFKEEKGRLVEMRHICDTLNKNLLSLHESVQETYNNNLKLGVHTLVNKEPQVVQGFNIPQMSPIEKVHSYLKTLKNAEEEAWRKRQAYENKKYSRRRRNITNSNVQDERAEIVDLSSVVGTSSSWQNNESTACNCGRAECNVCNPHTQNA
ncbi:hypothetical protein T4B_14403 [Trichinella pseudospiralis]|uniref:Uncharacterized protein n=1 Tax=Trichinella pseudospiralis TaxID=6337 RepID=A0A0V1IGH1_TRIPS|nr:hypothetical protein T4B_14403 [Trichinella pseudospiralis]